MLLTQVHDDAPQPDVVVPSRLVVRRSTIRIGPDADLGEQLTEATRAAQSSQAWLTAQEGVIGLNRALINCRSVADVVDAVSVRLAELGIRRCFLALSDDPSGRSRRLVLAHRDGSTEPMPDEAFEREALLPPALRSELTTGVLVLQPLTMADRERGHLLFEPVEGFVTLTEVFMIDLSRALDSIFSTEELQQHANRLESLVDQRTRQLQQANAELQRSVIRDGLTGIANRTAFEQHLDAVKHGRDEVALLMVDVDAFKAYNDHYGHLVGDQALKVVASCLEKAVREADDLACRYGGEEFAVILPRTARDGALAVAGRFRELLVDAAIRHDTSPVADVVTASIGIAVAAAGEPFEPGRLITAADQALYRAKLTGRDRVVVAGEDQLATITES
jgi:diguanylate cyclase (GGDEF)-like protein